MSSHPRIAFPVIAALAATLLASPGPALASEDEPTPEAMQQAREHFKRGQDAYKAGSYAEALAAFEAGYAAVARPGFLLNIAQTARKLGELKKARAHYKKFLLMDPESKQRGTVEQIIAEIDSAMADESRGGGGSAEPPARAPTPSPPEPPREDLAKSLLTELNKEPPKDEESNEGAAVAQADPDAEGGGPPGLGDDGSSAKPAGAELRRRPPVVDDEEDTGGSPIYKKWWFWAVIGAAAAGAGAALFLGSSSGSAAEFHERGSLGALRK